MFCIFVLVPQRLSRNIPNYRTSKSFSRSHSVNKYRIIIASFVLSLQAFALARYIICPSFEIYHFTPSSVAVSEQMGSRPTSSWRGILVLTPSGETIKTYLLDDDGRHVTQFQRQRKRNLWKMTGVSGFRAGASQDANRQMLKTDIELPPKPKEPPATTAIPDDIRALTSIAWLLNGSRPQGPMK